MSYAWQQLQSAIRVLATPGDCRARLHGALGKLIKLKPRDLPSEILEDFSDLVSGISRFPVKHVAQEIRTAVSMLDDAEVMEAIARIMRMYDAVSAYQPRPARTSAAHRPAPPCSTALHIPETRQNAFFHEVA